MSTEDKINPIHSVLHHTEVKAVVPEGRKIITLNEDSSVEEAVHVLASNHIQSCPVMNKKKECIGMVDMLDIASYIVSSAPTDRELEEDELKRLDIAGRVFSMVPLKQVIDFSGRDPLVPVYESSPASMVNEMFGRCVHHAVIFNKASEEIMNVLTQFDLIKFLAEHIKMGDSKIVAAKSAAELGIGASGIVTFSKNDTVIHALNFMEKQKVSSLAIVDPANGRLVGNFSASDLIGLYQDRYPGLRLSVEEFLTTYSEKSLSPICSTLESSLQDIVNQLVESHVHHLWVVDGDFKPTGIISCSDVCRAVQLFQYY